MLAQLGLQAPLQGRLDHSRQQTIIACQRGASIHLSEDPIQRPRRLELLRNLTLPLASLSPLLIHAHTHSLVSFPLGSHPLHKPSDTLDSDSSYRLLMRFLSMSFKLPDPFDKRRDEEAITKRMAQIQDEVADLLRDGWEVYTADEVRVEHEAETRRMWLPQGKRTKIYVDRTRSACSFFGALSLRSKKVKVYPIEGNQNTEQILSCLTRLACETDNDKIAVVLDNAGFHHAKALKEKLGPGGQLENLRLIYLPPYAPDHNPVEHVWNTAKGAIANIQRDTPEETYTAFIDYINTRTFDYDFEHLPNITPAHDLV